MKTLNTLLAALAVTAVTQIHAGTPPPQGIVAAASAPAVSAINGKMDANYGAINRSSTRGVAGSLSVPLGHS